MIPGGAGGLNDHPRRQYMTFAVGGRSPVAFGIDHPALAADR